MLNLARTRLILGSGWSSYSEVPERQPRGGRDKAEMRPRCDLVAASSPGSDWSCCSEDAGAALTPSLPSPTTRPEVAAYLGGSSGNPVPILMAGRDFGALATHRPPAAAFPPSSAASQTLPPTCRHRRARRRRARPLQPKDAMLQPAGGRHRRRATRADVVPNPDPVAAGPFPSASPCPPPQARRFWGWKPGRGTATRTI